MASPRYSTLDQYLASVQPAQAQTLRAIIEHILGAIPGLEVKLAWNVPQIQRDGQYVFGASALKKHLSLAPWSEAVIENFRQRLENDGYTVKKNLFQVPDDWDIDHGLLTDLVGARLAELGA
jgi:uncharacterized protein YdhG (YjbR/CyaY superfamily)